MPSPTFAYSPENPLAGSHHGHDHGHDHGHGHGPVHAEIIEGVDAAGDSSTAYSMEGGDTFLGELAVGDVDWVEVSLGANQLLIAEMFAFDVQPSVSIVDNSGNVIGTNIEQEIDYSNSVYANTTGATQSVFIAASDVGSNDTGLYGIGAVVADFFVEVVDAEDTTTNASTLTYEIESGEVFLGSIDTLGDVDLVKVVVGDGQILSAGMTSSIGANPLGDFNAFVSIWDETGNLLAAETDYGASFSSSEWANTTGSVQTVYIQIEDFDANNIGDYAVNALVEDLPPPLVEYTIDEIKDYLVYGYWPTANGYAWDVVPGDVTSTISFNIQGLNAGGQAFALAAIEAWTMATGLQFELVTTGGDLVFDDEEAGAFANFSLSSATTATGALEIVSGTINISTDWILPDWNPADGSVNLDSYSFQTYIHEIGHALGLGHAGPYNGFGDYSETGTGDNTYLNDSWQATVMSYFSQTENTFINADFAYVVTPMIADIAAIDELYGLMGDIRTGATVYGVGSTAGGYYDDLLSLTENITFTLIDDGGIDLIDLSVFAADQFIDLNGGAISNVGGLLGNMIIFTDTVIENATGGSGADIIVGNQAANHLQGALGQDELFGGVGNDNLEGGASHDDLFGGANNDTLDGGSGNDTLNGGEGHDWLYVWTGNDAYDGGEGVDTIDFSKLGSAIMVNLMSNAAQSISAAGGTNTFEGFEHIVGSKGGDTILATNRSNDIDGFTGNDVIIGLGGNDYIIGGSGNDELRGNNGSDTLVGNIGRDLLLGGSGEDTFVFLELSDSVNGGFRDRIAAFEQGIDLIDLSSLDAIEGGADDAFTFIGTDKFGTATAGALRYFEVATGKIIVEVDVDGDNVKDFQFELTQISGATLTEADFIL